MQDTEEEGHDQEGQARRDTCVVQLALDDGAGLVQQAGIFEEDEVGHQDHGDGEQAEVEPQAEGEFMAANHFRHGLQVGVPDRLVTEPKEPTYRQQASHHLGNEIDVARESALPCQEEEINPGHQRRQDEREGEDRAVGFPGEGGAHSSQ